MMPRTQNQKLTPSRILLFLGVMSVVSFALATAIPAAKAAICACYDPGNNTALGPTFLLPTGGDCNALCSADCRLTSPDHRCALCAPEGSLDCGSLGGGGGTSGISIETVLGSIKFGINNIIVWLFLLATVLLLIGVVRYITAGGDEKRLEEARRLIMYGVLGLAVMVTVWAFVTIIIDFFFSSGTNITIPGSDIVNPI